MSKFNKEYKKYFKPQKTGQLFKRFLPLILVTAVLIVMEKAQTTQQKIVVLVVLLVLFGAFAVYNNFKKAADIIKQMYEDEANSKKDN